MQGLTSWAVYYGIIARFNVSSTKKSPFSSAKAFMKSFLVIISPFRSFTPFISPPVPYHLNRHFYSDLLHALQPQPLSNFLANLLPPFPSLLKPSLGHLHSPFIPTQHTPSLFSSATPYMQLHILLSTNFFLLQTRPPYIPNHEIPHC